MKKWNPSWKLTLQQEACSSCLPFRCGPCVAWLNIQPLLWKETLSHTRSQSHEQDAQLHLGGWKGMLVNWCNIIYSKEIRDIKEKMLWVFEVYSCFRKGHRSTTHYHFLIDGSAFLCKFVSRDLHGDCYKKELPFFYVKTEKLLSISRITAQQRTRFSENQIVHWSLKLSAI